MILFELTGALSHVLPIMISVMVSKWVADAFGEDGIYSTWIAMRQYPWLPAREFRDDGQTAAHVMKGAANLVVVHDDALLGELDELARTHAFRGFPVVRGDQLLGFVLRDKLQAAIGALREVVWRDVCSDDRPDAIFAENPAGDRRCTFVPPSQAAEGDSSLLNLSSLLEEAVLQLRKDVPLELVVNMFQKLVRAL